MVGTTNVISKTGEDYAAIIVSYTSGAAVYCTNDTAVLYAPDTSGSVVFFVPSSGSWKIYMNGTLKSTVSITYEGQSVSRTIS